MSLLLTFYYNYFIYLAFAFVELRVQSPAAMPETTQDAPAKDSPFFIKNLLNCDKPAKPKPALTAAKAALEGGFSLSQVEGFSFPRFDVPAQRFTLPAHYLERTSAWWYPYTLSSAAHLHRSEGKHGTLHSSACLDSSKQHYSHKRSASN